MKKLRIEFAPGVLEQMEQDMDPEELQEFLDMLKQKAEDGSLLEEAREVDLEELQISDPDIYEALLGTAEQMEKRTLH